MGKHICNLCFKDFKDTDALNYYCPECQEKFEGTFMMKKYKFKIALTELKIEIKKALKDN